MDRQTLGLRVLVWRRRAGLTQQGLAERAGLARETVARIERGVHMPNTATLNAVAEALDKPLSALLAPGEAA